MGYVGSRMRRLEDPRLLAGVGHFADDEERPGQLWMLARLTGNLRRQTMNPGPSRYGRRHRHSQTDKSPHRQRPHRHWPS
jgi:hypothetical protein